jgi:hypothetical protein
MASDKPWDRRVFSRSVGEFSGGGALRLTGAAGGPRRRQGACKTGEGGGARSLYSPQHDRSPTEPTSTQFMVAVKLDAEASAAVQRDQQQAALVWVHTSPLRRRDMLFT